MNRRLVLTSGAALVLASALPARAEYPAIAYEPGLVSQRLSAGETVFLDFKADWCTTCRAQGRQIASLLAENPGYGDAMTFVEVDWDTWRGSEIVESLRVPRRSTLIVLRGNEELGRIVANPRRDDIKALMDLGLSGT